MKKNYYRIVSLFLTISDSVWLSSCVEPNYAGGNYHSSPRGGYGVYNTLPGNFTGDAYYYNGRYYSGGSYQTGHYNHQGRSYNNRYYHQGQYFYGGNYQQHSQKSPRHDVNPSRSGNTSDSRNSSHRTSDQSQQNHPPTGGLKSYGHPGG